MDADDPPDENHGDLQAVLPIPNPPEGGIPTDDGIPRSAESINELLDYLNAFAKQHGFAIIRRQGSNKRKETGEYTRWSLYCDRDAIRASEGHGLRRSTTQKNGCPWKGIATSKRSNGWG